MCRLFGLHAGRERVSATLWLLNAPDSLAEQSRRNPDGTGIGLFGPDGRPVVDKQPMAAWQDHEFATEAHELRGTTFIAHVRYASTGATTLQNTHPFLADGRIFAHNGVVTDLDVLDARIAELDTGELVHGQTDSERVFAVICGEIRSAGGDVEAGLVAGLRWVAGHVGVFALNVLMATATDLWAVRYPEAHELYLLDRRRPGSAAQLVTDRIHAHSDHLVDRPSVVVATEPMDGEDGWQPLAVGELVHVDADLTIHRRVALAEPPAHQLSLADLTGHAAASQTAAEPTGSTG